jgi:hypothetical protein
MPKEIIFGYETALQICRSAKVASLARCMASSRYAPSHALSKKELQEAIATLSKLCPGIQITYPVHHLINNAHRPYVSKTKHAHSLSALIPRASLYRLVNGLFIAAPPLAFMQECTRRNRIEQLRLGWELCGSYQGTSCHLPSAYGIKPLCSVESIRGYAQRYPSLRGSQLAIFSTKYIANFSASPRETQLALLLGLPTIYGGAGLGIPQMNFEIGTTPKAKALCGKGSLRCDLFWKQQNIDVEYQSDECHKGEEQRINDSRRINALMSMGITVLCITNAELVDFSAFEAFAASLRKCLGIRQRSTVKNSQTLKLQLRHSLGIR